MCFTLTILWKHTLFLGFSLLAKHSFEGWVEFLLNVFFKRKGVCLKHYAVTCTFYRFGILWREKKNNLVTKSEGNFFLNEILDFTVKRVCCKWRNCFSAKSFTDGEFLSLRYIDVRFILEDIKFFLFC